jgi:hypothetical protein
MSTARKHAESSQPKGPIQKEIQAIHDRLDKLLTELSKNKDYPPLQGEIDDCAKKIMNIGNTHYEKLGQFMPHFKNAIVDLTEVPFMHPEMQKIAFEVAIQAAMKNLDIFLRQGNAI